METILTAEERLGGNRLAINYKGDRITGPPLFFLSPCGALFCWYTDTRQVPSKEETHEQDTHRLLQHVWPHLENGGGRGGRGRGSPGLRSGPDEGPGDALRRDTRQDGGG